MRNAGRQRRLWVCGAAFIALIWAPSVVCASASLRVWGEPGESFTGGGTLVFDSTSTFRFDNRLGGLACSIGSPLFSLYFRGSALHSFAKGRHEPLVRSPNDNESTMDESYQGRGCRSASGLFQVRKLAYRPDGTLREAWITWTTRCGASVARQFGELRVNADTTIWQDLPADQWCTAGDSAAFEVSAFHAGGRSVTFQVAGLPAGASFVDLGAGRASFRWKTSTLQAGQIVPVSIIASDDQGSSDTSMTRVRVVPYARITVVSDVGDPVGGGLPFELSGPETAVQLSEHQPNLGLQVNWIKASDYLHFAFVAPFGRRLESGVYEGTSRAPFQSSMTPGLDVAGRSSCNKESGRFTIRRLKRDAQGVVTGIWATVENRCENAAPALRAEMRYNIDTTLYVLAPADVNVEVGQPVIVEVAAVGTIGRPMQIEVTGLPAGATFTPTGAAAGSIQWRAPSEPVAEIAVHVVGTDDQGGREEVVTRIHVSRPARFYLSSILGDCNGPNPSLAFTQLTHDFRPLPRDTSTVDVSVEAANSRAELVLRAPFGQALRRGTFPLGRFEYTGADRILGYMQLFGGSLGYTTESGNFHIRKWRRDADGYTRSLWATWRSGCGSSITKTGQIIMNADTSLYLTAPGIAMVERGRQLQMEVSGTSVTGAPVSLTCLQAPAGSSFTPAGPGRATLSWNASVPAGNAFATFIGSDPSGNADTMTTLIRVMRPQRFVVDAAPSHWVTVEGATRLDATNSNFEAPTPNEAYLVMYAVGRTWSLRATAPYARRMSPGVYVAGLQSFPSAESRTPTFRLGSRIQSTVADSVWFHVRKIAFDERGNLTQLWVPFDVKDYDASHVKGELRFGDPDTTLYMEAPADVYVNQAGRVEYAVKAVHAFGRPVTLSARGLPGTATFVDDGSGTGHFSWSVNAPENSTFPVTVLASDGQGATDTCVTYVHVVVSATLQTVRESPEPEDPWATSTTTDATRSEFRLYRYMEHGAVIEVQEDTRNWSFYFAAPNDEPMVPRTYSGAVGIFEAYGPQPVLGILVYNRGCPFTTGSTFTVLDARYDADGHIAAFAATFRDTCDTRPALSGEIRYGARTGVVATLASRLLADGGAGFARLAWRISTTGGSLSLERREGPDGEWLVLESRVPDGLGKVSFEDHDVIAGHHYDYRLVSSEGSVLDQVALTISSLQGFRILSLGPNPVNRTIVLQTAGQIDGPIKFRVMDIAGRVVWSDVFPTAGGVRPSIELRLPTRLSQGVYVLHAEADGDASSWRFAVVQ